jgi:cytochrome o ubiquinol oxidase subunit IV
MNKPTKESANQRTLKSYIMGFVWSIVLTLIPYFLIVYHILSGYVIVTVLLICAMAQLFVQMYFFLHMKGESKQRLNLVIFISFFGIILIVVVASIWIMQHLNYNMSLLQLSNVMQYGEGF